MGKYLVSEMFCSLECRAMDETKEKTSNSEFVTYLRKKINLIIDNYNVCVLFHPYC
jgi:hypothetical protein